MLQLAVDLCNTLKNVKTLPVQGHPRTSPAAKALCMLLKVRYRRSTRVMWSVLQEIIADDLIDLEAPISRNSYNNYFKDEASTVFLTELFFRTLRPIRKIETVFVADASAFASAQTDNWHMSEYGTNPLKPKTTWLKLHAMVGLDTGMVTAFRLTENVGVGTAGDPTNFPDLLKDTARTFRMEKVLADGAYAGEKYQKAVLDLGAIPYIPISLKKGFKVETKEHLTRAEAEMLLKHQQTQDFDDWFVKRNKVEAVFSVIKRLNDAYMWCRKPVQRHNEMICKLITYNLRRLVRLEIDYGDDVRFGSDNYFLPRENDTPQDDAA